MQVRDILIKQKETIAKLEDLVVKTATNTERYYWEVRQLKETITELVKVNKELTESIQTLIKMQLGD